MSENLFEADLLPIDIASPLPHAASDLPLCLRFDALIDAYRKHGYRCASVDPLALCAVPHLPELTLGHHGLLPHTPREPRRRELPSAETAEALLQQLKRAYCGPLTLDSSAVRSDTRRRWLHARLERELDAPPLAAGARRTLLRRLVDAQAWERRVAEALPHAKRFSLEGCEALIPLFDALAERAASHRIAHLFIGMPHRGRLNVLVNVMGADAATMLARLDEHSQIAMEQRDLAYHLGATARKQTAHGALTLTLAHNPSHLQSVYPVVCGMTRAFQDEHPEARAMPLIVHGDAAFAGQGIVTETLNLTRKRGYASGGAVHVVVNNQIGFTTPNRLSPRENEYCTDVARTVDAPVLRVNADHPEAVLRAAAIAIDYRMAHGCDIVIDLVGYRRLGHSEHDIPALTQPGLQASVAARPSVVERYHGEIGEPVALAALHADALAEGPCNAGTILPAHPDAADVDARGGEAPRADKPLSAERLRALARMLMTPPPQMKLHEWVQALHERWHRALQSDTHEDVPGVDWCLAENLAYATILDEGQGVRISGMDVGRGTFMHRHAVWHSQLAADDSAGAYVPLRHLSSDQGPFDVIDSPLTEEAVLAFEYGYSVQSRARLSVWEAQFGDFVNGAQVIIDQYIASGEYKWGYRSALTVLLPHGHEGVGPEHSTGYLSRFLQLCAQDNLRVVMPSMSAQWFHLLREQARAATPRPLIVMSPKSQLYGNRSSHSPLHAFAEGAFAPVLDDPDLTDAGRADIRRVVICAGKLFHELRHARALTGPDGTALLRLEQLYPFPAQALASVLARYTHCTAIVWAQEEEKSHGAWHFIRDALESLLPAGCRLSCVCRSATPSGAHASIPLHQQEQRRLHAVALGDA
jgi:2-oxoglutarate dehydrogenase E1 component